MPGASKPQSLIKILIVQLQLHFAQVSKICLTSDTNHDQPPPSRWSHFTDSRPTANISSGRYSGTSDNVKEAQVEMKIATTELATVASSGNKSRDARFGLASEEWDERHKQREIERDRLKKERLENERPEKEVMKREHELYMDREREREKERHGQEERMESKK